MKPGTIKPKLLVVDDEPKNLHAVRRMLSDMEFEIIEAKSGEEALRLIIHHTFFLILMDVQMPEMDGFETASLIIGTNLKTHTPLIFITGNSFDEHYVNAGYEVGAIDYITKPINPEILISKIYIFNKLWKQEQHLKNTNQTLEEMTKRLASTNLLLRESNQKLQEFSHVAAHDLKQPLSTIIGFSNRVLKESKRLSERQVHSLGQINDAANRMSSLISGVLEYAKINTTEKQVSQIDLRKVVESVLRDLNDLTQKTSATIDVGEMLMVEANETQMYQVILNLISNALKFHHPDRAPKIKIACASPSNSNEVQLIISDNGIGFDTNKSEDIFSPFKRLVGGDIEGSGIGLSTVKRIIQRHKGSIEVDSQVGEGSQFTLRLPVTTAN